ncbi:MAG: hypothetical protein MI974_24245 [Chitinophagales bacterium]|nr:hypothetical protein [Chitinophagales bacterium]
MYKREEVKNKCDQLHEQLAMINLLGEDLVYLFPKDESTYHRHVFTSKLLERLIEGLKVNFALKVCTFLSHKEDSNICSFISYLLINHSNSDWKELITIEELHVSQKGIETIKSSLAYKVLLHIRNRHYAHLDKNRDKTDLEEVLHDEVMKMIKELIEIFQTLAGRLFETYYNVEFMHWDVDHNLIQQLSGYYETRDLIKIAKYDQKTASVSLKEIEESMKKYTKN